MKTFHRLMYENLTPEEYKELCSLGNIFEREDRFVRPHIDFSNADPCDTLESAFVWVLTPQGHDYWSDVANRLERQSRSDTI